MKCLPLWPLDIIKDPPFIECSIHNGILSLIKEWMRYPTFYIFIAENILFLIVVPMWHEDLYCRDNDGKLLENKTSIKKFPHFTQKEV